MYQTWNAKVQIAISKEKHLLDSSSTCLTKPLLGVFIGSLMQKTNTKICSATNDSVGSGRIGDGRMDFKRINLSPLNSNW